MIEREYDNPMKVWVGVLAGFTPLGTITPVMIRWDDGKTYKIDEVDGAPIRCASTKAGGIGERYRIRLGRRWTHLWLEEGRWFMEREG